MVIALLMLSQAIAGPPAPASPPARIDLMAQARQSCEAATASNDIVVCGDPEGDAQYRLKPLPDRFEPSGPPRAEMAIGNTKASVETESVQLGGVISKRLMVRLKLPF